MLADGPVVVAICALVIFSPFAEGPDERLLLPSSILLTLSTGGTSGRLSIGPSLSSGWYPVRICPLPDLELSIGTAELRRRVAAAPTPAP